MGSNCVATVLMIMCLFDENICFVNVAYSRSQSIQGQATMSEPPQHRNWQAYKVIDGNTNQTANGSSCAIIEFYKRYTSVWLSIHLQRLFNVAYTEIYFRNEGTIDRLAGFSIYAYYDYTFNISSPDPNSLIYRHDPMSGCPAPIQNITINRLVRQIVFTNNRPVGYKSACPGNDSDVYTSIEICEIKVMGCDKTRYSPGCVHRCPDTCKSNHCDVFNGSCLQGCPNPNALTEDCIVCADGQYIFNRECVNCSSYCKDISSCNKLTGKCENGCIYHRTGDFCQECSEDFYGRDCNKPCGHCRGNAPCDSATGHCSSGCQNYWTGDRCEECSEHFYGRECNKPCGHCRGDAPCNSVTGQCPSGCQNNWTGDRCDECADGHYNALCYGTCGHCLNKQVCDKYDGSCPSGCKPNFDSPLCQECRDGFYNSSCSETCGHCLNKTACNKSTGHCSIGCMNHFRYPFCQECEEGYYGNICSSKCGHCANGETCDKHIGICNGGCAPHFLTPYCQMCQDGFYNASCTAECGHCLHGEVCDKQDGTCMYGCSSNFLPPLCQDCIPYKYGPNCAFDCGHCKNGEPCSTDTGLCTDGCEDGWTGGYCVTVKDVDTESETQKQGLTTTGVVALAITSALLGIAFLTIFFLLRHVLMNQTTRQGLDIPLPQNKESSQTFSDLNTTEDVSVYTTLGAMEEESSYEVLGESSNT